MKQSAYVWKQVAHNENEAEDYVTEIFECWSQEWLTKKKPQNNRASQNVRIVYEMRIKQERAMENAK